MNATSAQPAGIKTYGVASPGQTRRAEGFEDARALQALRVPIRPIHRAAPVLPGAVDVGRRRGLDDLVHFALGEEPHLLADCLGLHLQLCVQLQIDRGVDRAAHVRPDHHAAVAAHQTRGALGELFGEIAALRHGADQQIGVAELLVLVPDRHLVADAGAHVHHRPHLVPGDAVGNDAWAVVVDHHITSGRAS